MNKYNKRTKYKKNTSIFYTIKIVVKFFISFPWWINCIIAFFLLLSPIIFEKELVNFQLPYINREKFYIIINYLIFFLSGLFFVFSIFSTFKVVREKRLLKNTVTIQALYQLNWKELENLVKALFVKDGYRIKERGGAQADGGVDLEAYGNKEKIIVQCKQWKSNKVGVSVVREMFGVMIHEKAQKVYIITCGSFTKDAKEFAKGKPVYLINGFKLVEMINKNTIKV